MVRVFITIFICVFAKETANLIALNLTSQPTWQMVQLIASLILNHGPLNLTFLFYFNR
jgi:hypothetical protein